MKTENDDKIKRVKEILTFYSNSDNYWSDPLSLSASYCMRTLTDVSEAKKGNKILEDRGDLATEALRILNDDRE